ncbi:MAG: ABC transporter substrate-binding protein [Candidatus Binatia bacterium]
MNSVHQNHPCIRIQRTTVRWLLAWLVLLQVSCHRATETRTVVTFPSSAVGAEGDVLQRQLARFMAAHPDITVLQQATPDAADQRHQLYVQWLNAGAHDPDILQLDVIWTAEFAAAGWLLPLDPFSPATEQFFSTTIEANRWAGRLYALPWFVDVGMLYWRTDLLTSPPATFADLTQQAATARRQTEIPFGFVWQGARYEGLVTVFLEHLSGFGGRILDDRGRVVVDSDSAVHALSYMCDSLYRSAVVPPAVLTWQEEQTRFAFQNGQALFMRNWPYAAPLLQDRQQSQVAGKFAVAPLPASAGGSSGATLGGSQLAINAHTDHPQAAYAIVEYLTRAEQMIERARVVGQYPPRPALYDGQELVDALPLPPPQIRVILQRAIARPVTPVYTELSEILQIALHRALTRQQDPTTALREAAQSMRSLLAKVALIPQGGHD